MKRVLLTLLFLVLPVLLVVWQVCFADTTSWYLVAAVLLLLSALPFFLHLERKPISAREMALLSVLTALAVVSRAVFYLWPVCVLVPFPVIWWGRCPPFCLTSCLGKAYGPPFKWWRWDWWGCWPACCYTPDG